MSFMNGGNPWMLRQKSSVGVQNRSHTDMSSLDSAARSLSMVVQLLWKVRNVISESARAKLTT
jgi:hypothetical protein